MSRATTLFAAGLGLTGLLLTATSALAYDAALVQPATVTAHAQASRITSPQEAFGHAVGADYHLVNYTQWEAYLKTLASQSDRMKLVEIGKSSEGRTQYIAIVSTPENLAHLDRYQEIARRLAKAEGVTEDKQRHLSLFRQHAAVAAIVIHAVIGGDHHLITRIQPVGQIARQYAVGVARRIAVLRR